jgi:hypothetical protein
MGRSLLRYALVLLTFSICSAVLADTPKAQQSSPESIRLRWREDGINFLGKVAVTRGHIRPHSSHRFKRWDGMEDEGKSATTCMIPLVGALKKS